MNIKVKKLVESAVVPQYAHSTDGAVDLVATSRTYNQFEGYFEYGTGLALEIPEGHVGLLLSRSSVTNTTLSLGNCLGLIDENFRGEIKFRFRPLRQDMYGCDESYILATNIVYNVGERVGQLLVIPRPKATYDEVEELSESDRGAGGFGSTGK